MWMVSLSVGAVIKNYTKPLLGIREVLRIHNHSSKKNQILKFVIQSWLYNHVHHALERSGIAYVHAMNVNGLRGD
jgi:hypothetical protein